jgi:hypothetical protein
MKIPAIQIEHLIDTVDTDKSHLAATRAIAA